MSATLTPPPTDAIAKRWMHLMSFGPSEELATLIHPDAVNGDPLVERGEDVRRGPGAFVATSEWLRSAYEGAAWKVHEVVTEGDLAVLHTTMTGRHTGVFVVPGPDGSPMLALPPTRREFAVRQSHWFRFRDGVVVEHWANRDDLTMARQLGWFSPRYLVRILRATWRARRSHRRVVATEERGRA
jgi:predicted ester cyclase